MSYTITTDRVAVEVDTPYELAMVLSLLDIKAIQPEIMHRLEAAFS